MTKSEIELNELIEEFMNKDQSKQQPRTLIEIGMDLLALNDKVVQIVEEVRVLNDEVNKLLSKDEKP